MRRIKRRMSKRNVFLMLALCFFCVTVCLVYLNPAYSRMEDSSDILQNGGLDPNYVSENKTLNPEWVEYKNATEEERLKYNRIPDVYLEDEDVVDLQSSYDQINTVYGATTSDSYYNLKDHNLTLPTRNQGASGLCWAFASLSSVEGQMLKSGMHSYNSPIRMSPRQLDYASTVAANITEGISPYASSYRTSLFYSGAYTTTPFSLMEAGVSPVVEDGNLWSWNSNTNKRSLNETINVANVDYYVTGYARYGSVTANTSRTGTDSWVKKIKQHILDYGEIAIGSIGPSATYGGACVYIDGSGNVLINKLGTCNSPAGDANSGHSMTIIGWNDNYTYSYCKGTSSTSSNTSGCSTVVSGKGAWILKNSWGNSTMYPYLAYSSQIDYTYGITSVEAKNWDINYDKTKARTFSQPASKTYEVTYKKDNTKQNLKKITWKTSYANDSFAVYVKDGNGSYQTVKTGITRNSAGLYSVSVSGISLLTDSFSIKIVSNGGAVDDINAFTSYASASSSVALNTIVPAEIMNYNSTFPIYTTARNIPVGAKISYTVIGDNGADYGSIITFSNLTNINGMVDSAVSISTGISTTGLTLRTYYNGVLYDTDYIKVSGENGLWEDGIGSADDPFMIYTTTDFKNIFKEEMYMSSHFKLANDLDFSGVSYDPTTAPTAFTGSLDGDGHAIYNLTVSTSTAGLFKEVYGGTVKNLNMNNCKFSNSSGSYSGAIAATSSYGTFTNIVIGPGCTFSGSFTYSGGIVGFGREVIIQNVANYGSVSNSNSVTESYTGGIIGYSEGSYLKQVFNMGNLTGNSTISGGVAGRLELTDGAEYNVIQYTYNRGSVSSSTYHGGLVGFDHASTVRYAYALTTKPSKTEYFGHIVGGSVGVTYYYVYYPKTDNTPSYADDGTSSVGAFYAKTESEMKTQATYGDFDFNNIWIMKDSYPAFKTFNVNFITSISANDVTVNKNKTKTINYTVSPADAVFKRVSYTSTKASIAKVSSEGVVTGVAEGSTTIKLTALDGSGKTKTINVKVTNLALDFGNLNVDEDNYYILKVNPNTRVSAITNEITTSGTVTVKNKAGTTLASSSLITSGSTVNITLSGTTYKYTVVVMGDTTGIGTVKMSSVMKVADYLFDKNVMKEAYYVKAADVTGDGKITMSDVMKLANSLF